ncbi:hypothetical protein J7W19_09685 [Streptomyces mobaraensis NBRC 13819 = DSM 40847]|uniref:Uncharacterized protein n=2 Tax=Streptomyces mobaraensis TaxID=35621 RepID=A0A5N5WCP6_STRMB|nr:hypothetical protein [Streptomyces mobaraensis]EME97536.1 hypothetical protein H340_25937 [Streptomyces mobaraensis NBRC 13819 = DSM 40847]KAB7849179.1 hypothetical protein FRZ00_07050 [Streptomyces mobaraensis]QTT78258.1 hypothetical protein J7W19_09685 [Streptomyces mobaraensis NBRC 13819 = DSM 40847]
MSPVPSRQPVPQPARQSAHQPVRRASRAEEINRAIRAFLTERRGRALTSTERREYERMRAEWLAAGPLRWRRGR